MLKIEHKQKLMFSKYDFGDTGKGFFLSIISLLQMRRGIGK